MRLGEVQARGPQWSCGQSPWHKATEGSPGLLPRGGLWNIRCPCPPGGGVPLGPQTAKDRDLPGPLILTHLETQHVPAGARPKALL